MKHEYFDTKYLKTDLKGRSVRGGAVTMISQGVKFFLQMSSTLVLARLLTPQDFGLIAMVMVITSFVETFKDIGLSMATVQKAEINHAQISTLFWINVAISLAIMIAIAALAPAIGWFYDEPCLIWITLSLAPVFIFGGLTIQHQALLRRQMRFGALAAVEIISLSVGVAVAIVSAWQGAGYWSLVMMRITSSITNFIAVWLVCGWIPGLPVRKSGVRSMLAFGGYLSGFNFLNYFFRNFDKILIGRFSGSFQLGLYSKAYNLLLLPIRNINAPIAAVAIPALSILQVDPKHYRQFYLKAVYYISFVTMPILIFLFLYSKDVIGLLLGDQWIPAIFFFKILCVAAIYQPVTNTTGWLFISLGRTDKMFRWRISTIWLSVSLYVIGIYLKGAEGVAYGHTISVLILTIPCVWYAQQGTKIGTFNVFKVTLRPLFSGIFAGVCSTFIYSETQSLLLSFFSMAIFYLVYNCIFALSFAPIKDIHYIANKYLFRKAQLLVQESAVTR